MDCAGTIEGRCPPGGETTYRFEVSDDGGSSWAGFAPGKIGVSALTVAALQVRAVRDDLVALDEIADPLAGNPDDGSIGQGGRGHGLQLGARSDISKPVRPELVDGLLFLRL